jgi:hypothetical protein
MKELKKYQLGGAAKVAKKMSKLVNRSVKTGKSYTKPAKYKNVPTHSEYVRTKKVPKGAPAKKLTKKYSKLLNPPTSTKRVKIKPKERIDEYTGSKSGMARSTLNRNSTAFSDNTKKKFGQGFKDTRKHQGFRMPKKIESFVFFDTKDSGLREMGEKLKKRNTKWSKPKMVKGGSLRRTIKHK